MFKILKKENLAPNIYLMDVEAPRVARNALPGQFLIVRADEDGHVREVLAADVSVRGIMGYV